MKTDNNKIIRRVSAELIKKMVDSGVDIQCIASMLNISRPTIYNWLGTFFQPNINICPGIENLWKRFAAVRQDWAAVARTWDKHIHKAVKLTLYQKQARKILDSELPIDEKLNKLTAYTFSEWAKEAKK